MPLASVEKRTTQVGPASAGQSDSARVGFEFIDEVYRLYLALREVDDSMHAVDGNTAAERDVLFKLFAEGPLTVPALARRRLVSRQGMQQIVNVLLGEGLVLKTLNPAHEVSPLIALSSPGRRRVMAMIRRERRRFRKWRVSDARLRTATRTLQAVRQALELR